MSYKQKIIRTLRLNNRKAIGVLAKVTTTISSLGGDIGDIKTVSMGEFRNIRDISVICNDEEQLEHIVAALQRLPEITIEQVIDDVLEKHLGGKLKIVPNHPVHTVDDLRKVYTPGVASVSRLIQEDEQKARIYTSIGTTVALITNGTRVLGLGPIGPVASMPVMEGKAALFAQLTGLKMVPILLNATDPKEIIQIVKTIACGYSAIQLEDIRIPDCFEIEETLKKDLPIPVMHDDQHGTAVVTLAAAINACKLAKIDIKTTTIGVIGLGAAGSAVGNLIMTYTGKPVLGSDVSVPASERFEQMGGEIFSLDDIIKKSKVLIATTGRPGLIKPEMIQPGQVILALSNPVPEISIEEALQAGAAFASDGSRVNNILGFPGIFKGAIESRSSEINHEMLLAASEAIAELAPESELIPEPLDPRVHAHVARAVGRAAIASGVAGLLPDQP